VGFKCSGSPVSTGLLTKVVARTLILLLISFPSPWVCQVAAQQNQNPETAAAVEEVAEEVKPPIADRPPFMKGAGSAPTTILSIRRPDWVDGLKGMKMASVRPWQTSAPSPSSGQASQLPSSQSGSSAPKKSSKLKWILIAAAGGAAAGVFALKGKGGSGPGSDSTPTPTITAGPPTVGPPQ